MPSPYTIMSTESSTCGTCGTPVRLLSAPDMPSFYICPSSKCGFVGQVGVGPVKNVDAEIGRRPVITCGSCATSTFYLEPVYFEEGGDQYLEKVEVRCTGCSDKAAIEGRRKDLRGIVKIVNRYGSRMLNVPGAEE